jgi:hypothetical protein
MTKLFPTERSRFRRWKNSVKKSLPLLSTKLMQFSSPGEDKALLLAPVNTPRNTARRRLLVNFHTG